jgi:hypothetical protein
VADPIIRPLVSVGRQYGYEITLPFQSDGIATPANHLLVFARTFWVGWTHIPQRAAPYLPHLRHYRVRVVGLTVRHRLSTIVSANWALYSSVNELGRNLLQGSETDSLGETFAGVGDDGERVSALHDPLFAVTLVDGQSLHLEFRGVKSNGLAGGYDNDIAGTAEATYTDAQALANGGLHSLRSRHQLIAGDEDVAESCRNNQDPCFSVDVQIERLPD